MHPEILKGLSLGLSIQFFEYVSFEYFANLLQISKKIIKNEKKNIFYGFEYQFEKLEKKSKLIPKSILKNYFFVRFRTIVLS